MFVPSEDIYPLQTTNPAFSYTFQTLLGAEYGIIIKSSKDQLFLSDFNLGDIEVLEFQFYLVAGDLATNDIKLQATIIYIIHKLVVERENIIWYICDSADGRGAFRARLFDSWFRKYAVDGVIKMDGSMRESIDSENDLYVSVVINSRNPYKDTITQIFYGAVNQIDFSKNPGASL